MDDAAVGRSLFVLRRRQALKQDDVAARAGLSQSAISRGELGQIEDMTLRAIRAHARALGASLFLDLRWRGTELARVRDQVHAELVAALVARLQSFAWQPLVEVTYAEYGERGSIDVLGLESARRAVVTCEVKTDLVSVEATLRKLDEKARLAPRLVLRRFGWAPRVTARVLVLAEHSTTRRQLAAHGAVLSLALPLRSREVTQWLRDPVEVVAGIWVLSPTHQAGGMRVASCRRRVRKRIPSVSEQGQRSRGRPAAAATRIAPAARVGGGIRAGQAERR